MIVMNKIWERPIQLICPFEIRSTMTPEELNKRIVVANKAYPEAEVTRPKKLAKTNPEAEVTRTLRVL